MRKHIILILSITLIVVSSGKIRLFMHGVADAFTMGLDKASELSGMIQHGLLR